MKWLILIKHFYYILDKKKKKIQNQQTMTHFTLTKREKRSNIINYNSPWTGFELTTFAEKRVLQSSKLQWIIWWGKHRRYHTMQNSRQTNRQTYKISKSANVVSSNPVHGELYSIQHYVKKETDRYNISEILLKVALSTITLTQFCLELRT
jgi:hypothetical protein